ncbi:MAG TPA: hypothetical protein VKM54_01540 [Myxococcota bacterium]|nr:hypothetical protein [Myxococcota bacterium]
MKDCPDERTLERLFVGEGRARPARHVAACPECALRMRRIEQDLERIREALFADPPPELIRKGSRGRPARPLLSALVLGTAAACVAAVLWVRPFAVETTGSRSEITGFVQSLSDAIWFEEDPGAIANQRAVQLAALGTALTGGRPCTLEDQLDTNACDAQDVTTLAEGW